MCVPFGRPAEVSRPPSNNDVNSAPQCQVIASHSKYSLTFQWLEAVSGPVQAI